jgi:3-hydroxyacyl-CoA dehydrogenase
MIGRSWTMLFAGSGYKVCIYDNASKQVEDGLVDIRSKLTELQTTGHLRSNLSVDEQMSLIEGTSDLKNCVKDAFYIQVSNVRHVTTSFLQAT